jgi:hypothetical protein
MILLTTTVQNFFTIESFITFGGASLIVLILTNTYRKLTKSDQPLVAFIAAEIVAFIGAAQSNTLTSFGQYFVAFLNGCLLFCSALGINETAVAARAPKPPSDIQEHGEKKPVKWLSSWYRK